MNAEATVVPLLLFGSVFAFPLARRHLIHRHHMERLHTEHLHMEHRCAALPAPTPAAAPAPVADDAPALALRLPEPHRHFALALLCRLQDAPYDHVDAAAQFTLRQARLTYLPATLRAYVDLTPADRGHLLRHGRTPEEHLREQLEAIARGVAAALDGGGAAERRVLAQGHFLRERFGPGADHAARPDGPGRRHR